MADPGDSLPPPPPPPFFRLSWYSNGQESLFETEDPPPVPHLKSRFGWAGGERFLYFKVWIRHWYINSKWRKQYFLRMIQNQWASSTTIIWRIIAISIYNVTCNATTSSWGKTKWRVKGIKVTPTDFIFLFMIRVFLWSPLIRVQFYFIFIFSFDPSLSELIRPALTVRVHPVRLLYLPQTK